MEISLYSMLAYCLCHINLGYNQLRHHYKPLLIFNDFLKYNILSVTPRSCTKGFFNLKDSAISGSLNSEHSE